jgi:predicted Rossmann-fold nucleotide-binding protein
MTPVAESHVAASGATVFPPFTGLPYNPYRGRLYTPEELQTDDLDARIYTHQARWRIAPPAPIIEALAQRIHDHAIDDALQGFLNDHEQVVAIMGGHSLHRDADTYRSVALVARSLTRSGMLVVTGGGPGAMEAGNLGAWMAPQEDRALDDALELLASSVDYTTDAYLAAGRAVADRYPNGSTSLAIPTWFYGHEPTNTFATDVAKYFSNSIREDGLLAIATHGVVYTPGAAGTVQEVFMDATQNHYVTFDVISPMVFLDSSFWSDDRLGAPRLLRQLAGDRPYADMITVLDDADDIVSFIREHPPQAVS